MVLRGIGVLLGAVVAAWLVAWLSGRLVCRLAVRRRQRVFTQLHRYCHRPWTVALTSGGLMIALPFSHLFGRPAHLLHHALLLVVIGASAWLLTKALFVAEDAAFERLRPDVVDNRRIRRLRTQIALLRRITVVVVAVVAFGAMLMTFERMQRLGASLLASAGLIGAIAGFAAQSMLGNLFAGLQLAFSDGLRLDDVIVVEEEWGRVEEITLTYAVIRLWDERRLVLPTSYFTQKPFQNWTRYESRVTGTVLLHLDYLAPIHDLRAETMRILENSPLWDGRDWVLQVVDTTPSTMVVRVLTSAADAPSAWDLRCEVREKLIRYLTLRFPWALPRVRGELTEPKSPSEVNGFAADLDYYEGGPTG